MYAHRMEYCSEDFGFFENPVVLCEDAFVLIPVCGQAVGVIVVRVCICV